MKTYSPFDLRATCIPVNFDSVYAQIYYLKTTENISTSFNIILYLCYIGDM